MESVSFSKQDKITFRKDSKDYKEAVYANTQIQDTAETNTHYEVLTGVIKTPVKDKPSEKHTQRPCAQLKDRTVQILFVVQGLTIITVVALGVTLSYTGNDPLEGGWTLWTEWNRCSSTCGIGLQRRERTCSNPEPKFGGKHCEGEPSSYRLCSASNCLESKSAIGFTVYSPVHGTGQGVSPLRFSREHNNRNNVFNMSSGEFVCKQAGLYAFVNTFINDQFAFCYFFKNSKQSSFHAGYLGSGEQKGHYSAGTGFITYDLLPGDKVYLSSCTSSPLDFETSFSGFMVYAYSTV